MAIQGWMVRGPQSSSITNLITIGFIEFTYNYITYQLHEFPNWQKFGTELPIGRSPGSRDQIHIFIQPPEYEKLYLILVLEPLE